MQKLRMTTHLPSYRDDIKKVFETEDFRSPLCETMTEWNFPMHIHKGLYQSLIHGWLLSFGIGSLILGSIPRQYRVVVVTFISKY